MFRVIHLRCSLLNQGYCTLLVQVYPLIVIIFFTALYAKAFFPCSHNGFNHAAIGKRFALRLGSFTMMSSSFPSRNKVIFGVLKHVNEKL